MESIRGEHQTRRVFARMICSIVAFCGGAAVQADDEAQPSRTESRAAERLRVMRHAIGDFQARSTEIESEADLRFLARPLLRYNDESRQTNREIKGILDATLWRLGETGRPKAILVLEIQLVENSAPFLINEFVSLTPEKFTLTSSYGPRWLPHSTDLSMAEFDEAPSPAVEPRSRLMQMRELSRRFTVQENFRGEKISLRLLTQPIDRYDDPAAEILDGGLFVFANGTNPEIGLLLECSDKQWSYGLFRLTGATLLAQLDGRWILQSKGPAGLAIDAPYTAMKHHIVLTEDEGDQD